MKAGVTQPNEIASWNMNFNANFRKNGFNLNRNVSLRDEYVRLAADWKFFRKCEFLKQLWL